MVFCAKTHQPAVLIAVAFLSILCSSALGQQKHFLVNSLNNPVILRYNGQTGAADGVFASDPGLQSDGVDATIGPDGNLYVGLHGSDRVSKYEAVCGTGARLGTFAGGEPGSGPGTQPGQHLDGTGGLTFSSDGAFLYVVSGHNYGVLKYDGISGGTLPLATCVLGLSVNPLRIHRGPDGRLYFSAAGTEGIHRFVDFDSCTYETFVPGGTGGLGFQDAGGFTWGPDGHLYVASEDSDSILRFDGTTGATLPVGGQPGALFGWGGPTLDRPRNVTFGPDGNLYAVATFDPDHVHKYNGSTGEYMGVFAIGDGSPAGNFVLFVDAPDADEDNINDACDNCPNDANSDQRDDDHDGIGNVCDSDRDGDGIPNDQDDCPDNAFGLPVDCTGRPLRDCNHDCNVDGLDIQCILPELLGG